MPTTKNTLQKILFSILLLSAFFSCDSKKEQQPEVATNPNEITYISISHIGGTLGEYRIIKVTRDSVFAEKGATVDRTHEEWASSITAETWTRLISSIQVKDLDHIKSSPSQQSVDGIDETFQIRTPKKAHIFVNSFVDQTHYKQLQEFKEHLDNILPKEYK
ncbi:hypothetical protein DRF67_08555 [Chryseobacterium pennipullorum]|uniref:Uncharacterized protein n=2 Tax=Chryseobacterium pennipullorum TaxID=2258963 RepID=A0A3D9B3M2_9FLAO|nr:hypothetical protein DRF67_08555 [Chryseobacterium pennipullorum]